jgi:uncharacterized protein (DUF1015 family)
MSVVVPFRALRPRKQYVREVAAYPYDVLDWEEGKKIGEANPRSFLHVEKSEIDFPRDTDPQDPRVYAAARNNLDRLVQEGILFREDKPCFYVYAQRRGDHIQYGVVGCASAAEYQIDQIKKHELTTVDKEQDRIKNIDTVNANTGLVFCVYSAQEAINGIVQEVVQLEPEYDFIFDNGVAHTVWVVSDNERIEAIKDAFLKVKALYIADGHHRAASAAAVAKLRREKNPAHRGTEEYSFFTAGMFPHTQVRIMDYNRAVKDLKGLSEEEFLRKIQEGFSITPGFSQKSPSNTHEFGMYLGGKWFKLEAKEENLSREGLVGGLDVSVLQNNLLAPILGIHDPRTDGRIKFVGGIRGTKELEKMVDSKEFAVAFSMYPPSLCQLMAVADAGQIMPPKSTWFEPKLLSGLFVHLLD